jgi:hypothetical protein
MSNQLDGKEKMSNFGTRSVLFGTGPEKREKDGRKKRERINPDLTREEKEGRTKDGIFSSVVLDRVLVVTDSKPIGRAERGERAATPASSTYAFAKARDSSHFVGAAEDRTADEMLDTTWSCRSRQWAAMPESLELQGVIKDVQKPRSYS